MLLKLENKLRNGKPVLLIGEQYLVYMDVYPEIIELIPNFISSVLFIDWTFCALV